MNNTIKMHGVESKYEECVVALDGSIIWRSGVKYVPATTTPEQAGDPKRHPFKTNGFPVEQCLTCGWPERPHSEHLT